MLDYGFTEYQAAIRDLAREIAEKEIRPIAAEYDREAKFPWAAVKVMAETDLFRVYIDDEYGGISDGSPSALSAKRSKGGTSRSIALASHMAARRLVPSLAKASASARASIAFRLTPARRATSSTDP